MKNVEVKPFRKKITVPYSKSFLNRCLILASLNPNPVIIHGNSSATDVLNLIECLKKIGIEIYSEDEKIIVKNSFPLCEIPRKDMIDIATNDGGTTTRFLLPLLSLGKNRYRIKMSPRMSERPLDELVNALIKLKVKVNKFDNYVEVQGPAELCSELIIDCSKTSQEASGLLMVFSSNIKINFLNISNSKSYFELTQTLVKSKSSSDFYPVVDFSSIGYPAALAAVMGEVLITNCDKIDYAQSDSRIFEIFDKLGVCYSISNDGLKISKAISYEGFICDCSDCLDLVPSLCFLAAYGESQSTLRNLKNLKYKESDRLHEIQKILTEFRVIHYYDELKDELLIQGRAPKVIKKDLVLPKDHRIVMMGYLFLRKNCGGNLSMEDSVNKSFPDFFEMME